MTDSSASWSIDLTEEAAQIADASLIVRARFVEAADTMRHLDVRLYEPPRGTRSVWPSFPGDTFNLSADARNKTSGANKVSAAYGMDPTVVRFMPSRAAISRMEEVMHLWTADLIVDDRARFAVVNWSTCLVWPKKNGSWRAFCEERQISRSTADRDVQATFLSVARELRKSAKSLHHPEWERVMPKLRSFAMEIDRIRDHAAGADEPHREHGPTHWMAKDAKPANDPDARDTEWVDRRRQMAERKAG